MGTIRKIHLSVARYLMIVQNNIDKQTGGYIHDKKYKIPRELWHVFY